MSEKAIVVDVETTGLNPGRHTVIEVAWVDLDTGEQGVFVPPHRWADVAAAANPRALAKNHYLERIHGARQDTGGQEAYRLADALHGSTLAGSNPAFDAAFLARMFDAYADRDLVFEPTWHHRLLDLSAYAAGVLGLPLHQLPGLSDVCHRLGVRNEAPHSALGDATATTACFHGLFQMAYPIDTDTREVVTA